MRQQMLYGIKQLHKKHGVAAVRLQVRQLRHLPQLGGNDLVEIICGKDSAHTWTQKSETSAVRQQMLCSDYNRIESVGVPGFAYSCVSCVNCPSSVGMAPLSLLLESFLPKRGPQKRERRQQCVTNKPSHQKRGSGGVCLQVVHLRQFPQLGGNGTNEFILGKASAHTWSRKEGNVSAVRQQVLCRNNNRIRSVAVTVFAYRCVSSISCPNSVGMAPLILVS